MKNQLTQNITIPFFIPHEGCPHQCVFCNQNHISATSAAPAAEEIDAKVTRYLTSRNRPGTSQIAFFGGTFTALPLERQIGYLEKASALKQSGSIDSIRLSTRPDALSDEICKFLLHYQVDTVEVGIQSFDDHVLRLSGRGHNSQQSIDALQRLRYYNFRTGIQLMPGLPGSDQTSDIRSAQIAASFEPDDLRIYPTIVIKDTPMAKLFKEGKYHVLTLEEAIERSTDIFSLFYPLKTTIIRMGIHLLSQDEENAYIAGPYHPALGFLIKARFRRRVLVHELGDKISALTQSKITLILPKENYEEFIGHKRDNISYLENRYNKRITYQQGLELKMCNM